MNTDKLINNKTNIKAFDSFNDNYSSKVIALCQVLKKFCI